MQDRDLRVWKRIDILAPAAVQILRPEKNRDILQGVATDICPGGVYISSAQHAERDDFVDVDVDLVEFGEHLTESGRVVRSDAAGFAVRFLYRCERFDSVKQL